MKKILCVVIFFLLMFVNFAVVARSTESIKAGKWEMTSMVDIQGQGGESSNVVVDYENGQGATLTEGGVSTVVSPQQMKQMGLDQDTLNASKVVINGPKSTSAINASNTQVTCIPNENPLSNLEEEMVKSMPAGCDKPQIQKTENSLDYSVNCNLPEGHMDVSSHYVFTGETMQGTSTTHSNMYGMESNSQTRIIGKYIGPC